MTPDELRALTVDWTVSDLAAALGVAERTVYYWRKKGTPGLMADIAIRSAVRRSPR